MSDAGWVYLLVSDSRPGLVKIGRSAHSGERRAGELRHAEHYRELGPWREVWSLPVSDVSRVESTAHRMLWHKRLHIRGASCREVYRADVAMCRNVIVSAAKSGRSAQQRRSFRRSASWRRVWLRPRHVRAVVVVAASLALLWVAAAG